MCTAVSFNTDHHYFGRNLDLERGFGERVVITPQNYNFLFRYTEPIAQHHALIGMAAVINNYPLYFEATNDQGLSIAGLNFPQNAVYGNYDATKLNIAPFELIPYILSKYQTVAQVKSALDSINIVNCNFIDDLPATPLHWLASDKAESITIESTKNGLQVYNNPFGVLTNNPTFDYHLTNASNYMSLSTGAAQNNLGNNLPLGNYSLGLGALGLPGDFSSASRFVRAVFVKQNSVCDQGETASVNQFFHILQSVAMPMGCVKTANGEFEYTRYSCCCNTNTKCYYYTTYHDMQIKKVDMQAFDFKGSTLIVA